jgi:hypothetical protein
MKKLILSIGMLLLLFISGLYFWDLKNEVSDIKKAVTEQTENKGTATADTEEREKSTAETEKEINGNSLKESTNRKNNVKNTDNDNIQSDRIDILTEENKVSEYLKENGRLPDYYITKKEAQKDGWVAKEGNLCKVLPGRAIGGDIFTNREKTLPVKKGRIWYEADINYNCGRRNAQRLVFSNDGLIFVTHDHYKSFDEVK